MAVRYGAGDGRRQPEASVLAIDFSRAMVALLVERAREEGLSSLDARVINGLGSAFGSLINCVSAPLIPRAKNIKPSVWIWATSIPYMRRLIAPSIGLLKIPWCLRIFEFSRALKLARNIMQTRFSERKLEARKALGPKLNPSRIRRPQADHRATPVRIPTQEYSGESVDPGTPVRLIYGGRPRAMSDRRSWAVPANDSDRSITQVRRNP